MSKDIALVLSSGGSKGLAHIGVINELENQGFTISSISGSSIGSVCGGMHAMGHLDEYTKWVKSIDKKEVWGLLDFTLSTSGLLQGEKVFDKMKTLYPDMPIEDMNIPFTAVATDVLNEKDVVFNSGSFYSAVRASVAIPTIFTPVEYNNTILVDGGVLNPIPIEHVKRSEGDILVVVNLYGDKDDSLVKSSVTIDDYSGYSRLNGWVKKISRLISSGDNNSLSYLSLLKATTDAMVHKIAKQSIDKHSPDIVISIPYNSSSTFDFHRADELIEMGKGATKKAIYEYLKNSK